LPSADERNFTPLETNVFLTVLLGIPVTSAICGIDIFLSTYNRGMSALV
jgi:hypothetical protein